jgi:hypothetical protein
MSKLLSILILSLFALSTYAQWVGTGNDAPAYGDCTPVTPDESDACMMEAVFVNECYQLSVRSLSPFYISSNHLIIAEWMSGFVSN